MFDIRDTNAEAAKAQRRKEKHSKTLRPLRLCDLCVEIDEAGNFHWIQSANERESTPIFF